MMITKFASRAAVADRLCTDMLLRRFVRRVLPENSVLKNSRFRWGGKDVTVRGGFLWDVVEGYALMHLTPTSYVTSWWRIMNVT